MSTVIGVDLGGTKIALSLYNTESWESLKDIQVDTHAHKTFEHVYQDMLKQIKELTQDDTVAVGIGLPGLVTHDGTILTLPNIPGAEQVNVQEKLATDLALNVFVDNDANCFTLAEVLKGAAKESAVCIGISMGTGVGGGIVIDGHIFRGSHGIAGEIGHMILKPGVPPFETDDKRGKVEQFLSGTAFGKRCATAGKPEDYLDGDVCEFMRPEVFEEVAILCTNLIHLLDPDTIVFGGSAGRALGSHLASINKELTKWVLPGTALPSMVISQLPDAATLGAALLCF